MPDSITEVEKETKTTKKHPTDAELISQMIGALKDLKTIPKSKVWNNLTYVKKNRLASVNTFRRHFKTFENAINKAIEKIKEDGLEIYYQDRR